MTDHVQALKNCPSLIAFPHTNKEEPEQINSIKLLMNMHDFRNMKFSHYKYLLYLTTHQLKCVKGFLANKISACFLRSFLLGEEKEWSLVTSERCFPGGHRPVSSYTMFMLVPCDLAIYTLS
jgi:hypothetical protein